MVPSDQKISVIGLGRLGLPFAAVLACRGFAVTGVDRDEGRVNAVLSNADCNFEPGLSALLHQSNSNLSATTSVREAVHETDVTFVVVDTPRTDGEVISSENICRVMTEAGFAIARKASRQLVVLVSTSYPGSAAQRVIPSVESGGARCGEDFDFCYSPEFVALGDAVAGFLQPEFTLIGEFDCRSGDRLQALYDGLYKRPTSHIRMSIASAEVAKLALNYCLVAKLSCANLFAGICEGIAGANVDDVTHLLTSDRRIGAGFLRGGMPYGGKCFPRDVEAIMSMEACLGAGRGLSRALASVNESRFERLLSLICGIAGGDTGLPVAILGLSFKPDTDETAGSAGMWLLKALRGMGFPTSVHDPAVRLNIPGGPVQWEHEPDCVAAAELIVIATPWEQYRSLDPTVLRGKRVLDCWRILSGDQREACASYTALGVGPC